MESEKRKSNDTETSAGWGSYVEGSLLKYGGLMAGVAGVIEILDDPLDINPSAFAGLFFGSLSYVGGELLQRLAGFYARERLKEIEESELESKTKESKD